MFQTFLFLQTSMMIWNPSLDLGSFHRNLRQLRDHRQDQALFQLLAKHRSRSPLFKSLQDQDHVTFLLVKLMHYHLPSLGWNPSLQLSTLEVLMLLYYIHLLHQQHQRELYQIPLSWGSFKLQLNACLLLPGFIILPEPHRLQKPKNPWNPTKPRTVSKRSSTTSASPAHFSVKFMTHSLLTSTSTALAKAWEQEVFLCTYKFGITRHVGATSTQLYPLKLLCLLFWITFTPRTSSRSRKIWNHPEQECLHTSKLSDGFHLNSTFWSSHISRAKLSQIFSNQRLVSPSRDPKPLLFHLQYLQPGRTASLTKTLNCRNRYTWMFPHCYYGFTQIPWPSQDKTKFY